MAYNRLFIWVEGDDDRRFFTKIIKPIFQQNYDWVEVIPYATLRQEKINRFILSIKSMNADYIYVTDINNSPCIAAKKQKIRDKHQIIDQDRMTIVIKEIESWYLAGLTSMESKNFKIQILKTTDDITKEQFDQFQPKRHDSRISFMLEILNCFSIETAKQKNKSFKYFVEKYLLI